MDTAARRLALGAAVGVAVAVPSAAAGVVLSSVLWTNVGWTASAFAAMAALWRAARLAQGRDRAGWRLLAFAGVAWFAGQLFWDTWTLGLPVRMPGDLAWLAFAPLSAIGLVLVGSTETRGRMLVIETIPVIAATSTLVVGLLYPDVVGSSLGAVQRWISLGYPIAYAIVPVMATQVVLADRVRIAGRPDLLLITTGIAAQAVGFTLWAPLLLQQTYQVGTLLDAWWTVGLLLITAGALAHRPDMPELTSGGERRIVTVLPGLLFVALLGLALYGTVRDWSLGQRLILEVGSFAVGALIGGRIAVLSHRQRELLESERQTRSALEQAADELTHVALHDSLTKLPNRSLFIDRSNHALSAARRSGTWTAVLFLDIDDFKRINDVFGHSAGDALLRDVAVRLAAVVRPGDTVARFGGDEFTVLCPGIVNERHAIRVARRITDSLAEPFVIGGRDIHTAASIGIAFSAAGVGDAESLVRDADAAMYRAKERGRGGYDVFDETVRERLLHRLRVEDALRHGIENGELRLAFQPFVSLQNQRILGFEALLRWDSAELGVMPPVEFIHIAEQSGLMQQIGLWTIHKACEQIAALRAAHPELELEVAVNLSARQVLDPAVSRAVRRALRHHDLPARALALEITESDLIEDGVSVLRTLADLRALGVQLMLDDFGTGFSSLGYLKRFPVDALKIDRSFVSGLGEDSGDRAIVAAIMGVAQALDLKVIAEGVETASQAAELVALGCRIAQGFRYAEPTFDPAALLDGLPVTA